MAEYDKLEKGNEFVIVHVTVENIGNQKVRINPLDFTLKEEMEVSWTIHFQLVIKTFLKLKM